MLSIGRGIFWKDSDLDNLSVFLPNYDRAVLLFQNSLGKFFSFGFEFDSGSVEFKLVLRIWIDAELANGRTFSDRQKSLLVGRV